jgi:hypothetical protein
VRSHLFKSYQTSENAWIQSGGVAPSHRLRDLAQRNANALRGCRAGLGGHSEGVGCNSGPRGLAGVDSDARNDIMILLRATFRPLWDCACHPCSVARTRRRRRRARLPPPGTTAPKVSDHPSAFPSQLLVSTSRNTGSRFSCMHRSSSDLVWNLMTPIFSSRGPE